MLSYVSWIYFCSAIVTVAITTALSVVAESCCYNFTTQCNCITLYMQHSLTPVNAHIHASKVLKCIISVVVQCRIFSTHVAKLLNYVDELQSVFCSFSPGLFRLRERF